MKNFILKDYRNVIDHKRNVFGIELASSIMDLFKENIKSIVSKPAATLFSSNKSAYKTFVFVIVKVFDSFDCKISNEFYCILLIDIDVFLNVSIYVI